MRRKIICIELDFIFPIAGLVAYLYPSIPAKPYATSLSEEHYPSESRRASPVSLLACRLISVTTAEGQAASGCNAG